MVLVSILGYSSTRAKPLTGREEYLLSWKEIWSYTIQARKGNGNAAYKLGMYYLYINKNYKKSIYWFKKGVEVDNMDCLYELALFYEPFTQEPEHTLGIQYFEQLIQEANNGNAEAAKYLDKIPENIKQIAKEFEVSDN